MKQLYLLAIFFIPFSTINAGNTMSYTYGSGMSFELFNADETNLQNQMIGFGVRYYENLNIFYAGNFTSWNDGSNNEFPESGTIITANVGYRTSERLFFETSIGIGYLNNPDDSKINNDEETIEQGYATGHKQFEINFGAGYKLDKKTSILFGWTHFSNCQTICGLRSSYKPNGGRDFLRLNMETRF